MSKNYLGPILLVIIVVLGGWWLLTREPSEQALDLPGNDPLPIESRMVEYYNDVEGYYAAPRTGDHPGVVMVHEWWGLNENIKRMADELAAQGYQVLAVDLYNGVVATTPDEARAQTGALDQAEAINNMRGAVAYLRGLRASEVAVLGWCFGGGQALQLSMSGEPLAATVIYYGELTGDPAALAPITWPVLGIFGEEDTSVTVAEVEAFTSALSSAGIRNEIYLYPGVGHAFAKPSGDNYAPQETQDAWGKTLEFLQAHLKSPA